MKMVLVAVVLIAFGVTSVSLQQATIYEASAQVWADQKQGDQQTNLGGSREYRMQPAILETAQAIGSRPVAEETIQRLELEMTPA
jgi:uncharacterized protein involved in exopolysaccharide biosynthesis